MRIIPKVQLLVIRDAGSGCEGCFRRVALVVIDVPLGVSSVRRYGTGRTPHLHTY